MNSARGSSTIEVRIGAPEPWREKIIHIVKTLLSGLVFKAAMRSGGIKMRNASDHQKPQIRTYD
jgi:hypothetical protein